MDMTGRNATRLLMSIIAALALAACGEIPQDGPKPFAGKDETRSYAGGLFKGDEALYERTLAARARNQDEYLVTGNGK